MSHRDLTLIVARWLMSNPAYDLVSTELKVKNSVFDVIAVNSNPSALNPRVTVVEVKRTRADLLADLRVRKMHKYEKIASHCYLAATKEALKYSSTKEILADLKKKGLPEKWGVFVIDTERCIRPAKQLKSINKTSIQFIVRKIAKSLCWKYLLS